MEMGPIVEPRFAELKKVLTGLGHQIAIHEYIDLSSVRDQLNVAFHLLLLDLSVDLCTNLILL
jgi:hypothetical protein